MRPRPALLLGALLAPALPLLAAAPAQAASTICVVPVPTGVTCTTTKNTVTEAIAVAVSGDTIRLGSATYSDGPYVLPAGVSLRGSGAGTGTGATRLSLAAGAQTYVTVDGGTVADLRVDVTTGNGATGIAASGGAIVDNVVVFGAGAINTNGLQAQGSQVHDATVNVTGGSGNTAVRSLGGNLLYSESTWSGGAVGYRLVSGTDTVSRVTVQLAGTAVLVEDGTLNIDDSVLDLGSTGARGVLAHRSVGSTGATVNANFLTVVGGAPASAGVEADATDGGVTVAVTNSIVRGQPASLSSVAGGSLTVSRSNYVVATPGVTEGTGNLVGVDPSFVDPTGDYHLRASSPVVDKGVSNGPSDDRDSKSRSFDGDKDGTAVPDMGAYELRDVTAPTTTITGGPSGPTNDNTPQFTFRSGPDATFQCQVDGGGFQKCSSPMTTTPLPDGPHSFAVRALDPVFNIEATPPTRSFSVDTRRPDTSFTKTPATRFFKPMVKFKFKADEAGAHFQCRVDHQAWRTCSSPFRFSVKLGRHQFQVRAVDAAGNTDRSPERFAFKRVARHKHHHHGHREG